MLFMEDLEMVQKVEKKVLIKILFIFFYFIIFIQ